MNPAQMRLSCRMLEGYGDLPALRASWQALCDRYPGTTPFQRPEWSMPWVRHFGPAEPWLFAAHAGERLVGLAPLFRYRSQEDGQPVLALLGAGISDYLDLSIEPGWEHPVLAAVLAELGARRAQWERCELDDVRPSSPLAAGLVPGPAPGRALGRAFGRVGSPLPPGWRAGASAQSVCPVLALPPRVEQLGQWVPGRHLARFHQYRRRARREGRLRLERVERGDARGRERLLDGLFRLHQARWRRCGEPGMLAGPRMRAFHAEVAAGFAARDALALYGLWLGDRLIACLYGFFEARTLYFYLSGFDPEVARLSPGTLLVGLVIEDAIRRGMSQLDFLRGREPYKYWWGAHDRGTVRVCLRWRARDAREGCATAVHA